MTPELSAALVLAADSRLLVTTRIGAQWFERLHDAGFSMNIIAGAGLKRVEYERLALPVITAAGGADATRQAVKRMFGDEVPIGIAWHTTADGHRVPVFHVGAHGASFVVTDSAGLSSGQCRVSGVTAHPIDGYWQQWVPNTLLKHFINQAAANLRVYESGIGGSA